MGFELVAITFLLHQCTCLAITWFYGPVVFLELHSESEAVQGLPSIVAL